MPGRRAKHIAENDIDVPQSFHAILRIVKSAAIVHHSAGVNHQGSAEVRAVLTLIAPFLPTFPARLSSWSSTGMVVESWKGF